MTRTITLHVVVVNATVTFSADYPGGQVMIAEFKYRNRSGQKKHVIEWDPEDDTEAEIELLGSAAAGLDDDSGASVVEVGTARGTASVSPSVGATLTEIRNELVTELVSLGVSATANGVAGIHIEMAASDGDEIKFGSTDINIDMDASLRAAE